MPGIPFSLFSFRTGLVFLLTALLALCVSPVGAADPDQKPSGHNPNPLLNQYSEQVTLQKAEINYRARRLDTAMEQYGMIAAMDNHPFAWLRIGNICHRRGDVSGAFDAYRRARQSASGSARFAEISARAVMNLALLGLDQAQVALEDLGLPNRQRISGPWVDEIRLRLNELSGTLTEPDSDSSQALAAPLVSAAGSAGHRAAAQLTTPLR